MANALQHSRTRYSGLVNPLLAPVVVPAGRLVYHTNWSNFDGNYSGPGISKSGDQLWIDFGDGTVDRLTGSNVHSYLDDSTKTIQIWPSDDWSGVTEFYTNWGHCMGDLPDPSLMPNLVKYICDSTAYSGSLPSFSLCPNLEEVNVSGDPVSGTIPDFAACTHLKYFNAHDCNLGGALPDFSACVALLDFRINNNWNFTGVIPDFSACANLVNFSAAACGFTGFASGSFVTQANLEQLIVSYNTWSESSVDALLAEMVTSLSLSGRVVCYVAVNGDGMAPPSSQTDADTLRAAGWTVDTN